MYVGSSELERSMQLLATRDGDGVSVEQREIEFVPAVYKLFDELVTNAVDAADKDATLTFIKVTVGDKFFTVQNNGVGIPVSKHSKYEDLWVPELVFGHLNVSSNYDDSKERTVAGQNGLGVKLVNLFSDHFVVKVKDAVTGSTFRKEWRDGMQKVGDTKVKLRDAKPPSGDVDVYAQPARRLRPVFATAGGHVFAPEKKYSVMKGRGTQPKFLYDVVNTLKAVDLEMYNSRSDFRNTAALSELTAREIASLETAFQQTLHKWFVATQGYEQTRISFESSGNRPPGITQKEANERFLFNCRRFAYTEPIEKAK
jgi:hypothetical protein